MKGGREDRAPLSLSVSFSPSLARALSPAPQRRGPLVHIDKGGLRPCGRGGRRGAEEEGAAGEGVVGDDGVKGQLGCCCRVDGLGVR